MRDDIECSDETVWYSQFSPVIWPVFIIYICKSHLWTPKAEAGDLPFCLNIYLFSYFVFAKSVNSRLPRRMRRFVQMLAARRCGKHRLSTKYEYKTQTIQRCDGLSRVSSIAIRLGLSEILQVWNFYHGWIQKGDRGPDPSPLENHKLYLFLYVISHWNPLEIVGLHWKMLDPLWNLGKW